MRCPRTTTRYRHVLLLCSLPLAVGCATDRYSWRPAYSVAPAQVSLRAAPRAGLDRAEWHYAQAAALQSAGDPQCVDHFYEAAAASWSESTRTEGARGLYHSALTRLITSAQHHRRWDPLQGLRVESAAEGAFIPVSYHGFAWKPDDFDELAPVGDYNVPRMRSQFRSAGLGVPLVAVRHSPVDVPFQNRVQSFAATVALTPVGEQGGQHVGCETPTTSFKINFFNPLVVDRLVGPDGTAPLASDLSAPFAYPPRSEDHAWLQDFLRSGSDVNDSGLFMLEPYQPGKVPVVFVHGLLSDPLTWVGMVNELRACPELTDRYQFWAFRYSTGTQFFRSAALLRSELRDIRELYDPNRKDAAFSRMVLVGHSMGGLLAKLQVVYSGDQLWRAVCNRPPSALVATPPARRRLLEQLFFKPNPDIARVVFIGTPHQGSSDASRCIGRLGAALAQESAQRKLEHDTLVRDNPGIFKPEIVRRIPRSIDLLKPTNPLLHVTLRLPYSRTTRVNTICGVIDRPCWGAPSDGVVSLASARLAGVSSEKLVDAKHTDLTREPATIAEVRRLLTLHTR